MLCSLCSRNSKHCELDNTDDTQDNEGTTNRASNILDPVETIVKGIVPQAAPKIGNTSPLGSG